MPTRDDVIFWFDLETTGSDAETGQILEIGAVLTDATPQLNIIAKEEWLVNPSEPVDWLSMDPVVLKMHEDNGLRAELVKGRRDTLRAVQWDAEAIDRDVVSWIFQHVPELSGRDQIPYAGSGVGHFDRAWVRRYMPKLSRRLTYWPLDVGPVRRWYRLLGWQLQNAEEHEIAHRGLQDTLDEIEEMRVYLKAMEPRIWGFPQTRDVFPLQSIVIPEATP